MPPTASTSVILRCSNGTTRAVARRVDDMGKLRDVKKPVLPHADAAAARSAAASCLFVGRLGRCMAVRRSGAVGGDSTELPAYHRRTTSQPARPDRRHAQPHRVLRLRRHRHHRRDLRQLDPGAVRGQAAPRAPALHRHGRQGAPGGAARSTTPAERRRQAADRLHHAGQRGDPARSSRTQLQGHGAGHVRHLRRAAGGRVRHQVEPPRRPLLRRRQEPGIQRPHRGDQLLAGARRRPVGTATWRGRRDPGRRQPQRQDADLALPGDAARHQGGQLPADPRGLRARPAAVAAGAAQAQVLRPDDRPERLAQIRNERRPGSKYASLENCRYEVQRGRSDDAARRHRAGCRRRTSRSRRSPPRSCATSGRTG